MNLTELVLKNFRCYKELKITLDDKFTVLIGDNGAGKSTVLDAISIVLGSFIGNFDKAIKISKDDSLYKMYEIGSKYEREHQFPVEVTSIGVLNGEISKWKRSLKNETGRTTESGTKLLNNYIDIIKEKIRNGENGLILPVIAYYGTGRLWMQKRDRAETNSNEKFSRLKGYTDCLASASNEKLMLKWFETMTYLELQESKKIPELEVVKKAVSQCYKSIDENIVTTDICFSVKSGELELITKYIDGKIENLPLRFLSDGIKSTLSMIADIAYRMAVLNPQLLTEIKEKTPGIILIDEIDMHLHPTWQKKIIKDLCDIFPKVQFIFTTHSPTVLANIYAKHIRILTTDDVTVPQNTTYGRDINAILREIMDTDTRPSEIKRLIESLYEYIDLGNLEKARMKLDELKKLLGEYDDDFIRAKISLELEEAMEEI